MIAQTAGKLDKRRPEGQKGQAFGTVRHRDASSGILRKP
jgi:hypothetical protein